ncbi:hypothetical protein ABEP17_07815 [Priestia flexa]|uniref:hypothetical protein n=1 Tax=Priestia flexa TaxID=86664 RepID=UPI003CFC797C
MIGSLSRDRDLSIKKKKESIDFLWTSRQQQYYNGEDFKKNVEKDLEKAFIIL